MEYSCGIGGWLIRGWRLVDWLITVIGDWLLRDWLITENGDWLIREWRLVDWVDWGAIGLVF